MSFPHTQPTGLRSRLDGVHSRDFGEQLYDQLKNAPWVLCSVGVHAVLLGFLLLLPSADASQDTKTALRMETPEIPPVIEDEIEPEVPETPEIEEIEREDVIIEENDSKLPVEDDESEIDTDTVQGDPRFSSDSLLDQFSTNALIGIGPGAGGKWGNGLGGNRRMRGKLSTRKTQVTLDLALEWLKNHQSAGGHWDSDGFSENCTLNKCDGAGEAVYDPGLSGGALLCFLGAGETHNSGHYKETVRSGLRYLKSIQDSEGCFGPRTAAHFQYNHMLAALAMTEAYGLTGSRMFKDSAQRGVGFVQQSQNPYLAWRYGVRDGDNDTSVTGWAVMVLKSAKMSDLEVDGGAFKGAMAYIEKMTEPEFGRVGYQRRGGPPARTTEAQERFPADQSESMTGVGVVARIFAGQDPRKTEAIQKGADLMLKKPPRWDIDAGTIDFYYWYYATLAMFQVGGDHWKGWKGHMESAIVDHQRLEQGRDERGSWDPVDPWAAEGGRVYSTVMNALCMEVYFRYSRLFGAKKN